MISYQQFKKIYETNAAATPAAAAPQVPNIEDLEKQIDALFDELKTRIRDMNTPRKDWLTQLQAWAAGPQVENLTLEYYHTMENYFQELQEALTSSDLLLIDRLIDQHKAKFKQIMGTYKQQVASAAPARTRRPRRRPEPAPAASSTVTRPEPAPEPAPAASSTVTRPEPAPAPAPAPAASSTVTRPEEPAPAASSTVTRPEEPAPAATTTATAGDGGLTPEDKELIKLGAMVMYWHDNLGMLSAIPPEEMQELEKDFAEFKPEDVDDKDYLIKLAKEYKKQIGSADPSAGPVKGDIETKPDEQPVNTGTAPVKAEEAKPPTRRQLMQMSEEEFKQFMLDPANPFGDTQLDEMFYGEEWWRRSMRGDVVDNYLMALHDRLKKRESLQHYVNKYKKLLKETNRPRFLLREAVKLPLSKRASFYRKQLSCRET